MMVYLDTRKSLEEMVRSTRVKIRPRIVITPKRLKPRRKGDQ